jgi:hypothetical protein
MSDKIIYPNEPILVGVDHTTDDPDWLSTFAVSVQEARDTFYAGYAALKTACDGIHRSYHGGDKRFVQWFNSDTEDLENVPEVALCDEVFIHDEPDFDKARHRIDLLEVGESCIVEENVCIVVRVK